MSKRLVRAVEAIPLHLTWDLVRLTDALGESRALPHQACQTLQVWDVSSVGCIAILTNLLVEFKHLLKSVSFANNRSGAKLVQLDQFILLILSDHSWKTLVKNALVSLKLSVCKQHTDWI